jgi:hypothetical protein
MKSKVLINNAFANINKPNYLLACTLLEGELEIDDYINVNDKKCHIKEIEIPRGDYPSQVVIGIPKDELKDANIPQLYGRTFPVLS